MKCLKETHRYTGQFWDTKKSLYKRLQHRKNASFCVTLKLFHGVNMQFKNKSCLQFFIFPLHKVSDTQAVPLRLTPKLLKSLCILLVHMAFICNWFVSATVNAIHREHIRRLSLSPSACRASHLAFPSNQIRFKESTEMHSFPLYFDNWNKCQFETKSVCLIYSQCNSKVFFFWRQQLSIPFITANNVTALKASLKQEESIM